ncbi:RNA polymerase sigma-70 factor [Olivibacter ginsenosidimutans]|uniref:RNA polymerase sigma-70 factor n=1 Tax=Olivibacter ginsenosidimutans TaxID=1176537 RepID=A0ABP9CCU4_9SPHI
MSKSDDISLIDETDTLGTADFERLYRSTWKSVFGICYHYVRDQELAADLSQNVFEMAWKKRAILQKGTAIEKYLYRAAKLEAQSFSRSTRLHREHEERMGGELVQSDVATETWLHFRELQQQINLLLDELPSQSQQVYRLSREQGLDNKSIAYMLAVSEKTVEYHLYKVLAFLRQKIAH